MPNESGPKCLETIKTAIKDRVVLTKFPKKKVADIASRHGQLEAGRILPVAFVAAGEGQQEANDAFSGAALPRGEHQIAGRNQFPSQSFVQPEAERRILGRGLT